MTSINYRFFKNISSLTIIAAIALLVSACDERKIEDPAFVPGTVENTCMELANAASQKKYGMPAEQSAHILNGMTMTWIGPNDLKFPRNSLFTLHNMYELKSQDRVRNNSSAYAEGIWAGRNLDIEDLSKTYPAVFDPQPNQSGIFYLRLECSPIHSDYRYNPIEPKAVGTLNYSLGLIEYPHGHNVVSTPIDKNISYPDGSPIIIECTKSRCSGTFLIEPKILVRYDYPSVQRKNWLKILKLIIDSVNQAKE